MNYRNTTKVKLEDISKKHPFIYEIDNTFYIMGANAFEEYDSIGLDYYRKYRECINKFGREKIYPYSLSNEDPKEVKNLVRAFSKVKTYADAAKTDNFRAHIELEEFIANLSEDNRKKLLEQLEDYVNVFWYYDRSLIQEQSFDLRGEV